MNNKRGYVQKIRKKKKNGGGEGGINHTAENLDIKQEKPVSSVMNMMKELNIFMRK